MLVFTYGTLMQGFSNHRVMEQAQGKFVGRAKMYGKAMYYAGGHGSFPAVIDGKDTIYGEVFDVPENVDRRDWNGQMIRVKAVTILDGLEGYNPNAPAKHNMYLRKKAKVILEDGKKVWVSYYYWNRQVSASLHIPSGDFKKK